MTDATRRRGATSIAALPNVKVKRYKPGHEATVGLRRPAVEPLEADWASEHLAHLDVIVRTDPNGRKVKIWQDETGEWYRSCGAASLTKMRDGELRFLIWLRRGANLDDLQWLERVVAAAKQGAFLRHGWVERASATIGTYWSYGNFPWARKYADPFTHSDPSPEIRPCTDNRCSRAWHYAEGFGHVADTVDGDDYRISVTRYEDPLSAEDTEDEYRVTLLGFDDVDLSPAQVASLASDLQWMAETCRQVNSTAVDPIVKGISRPAEYWQRRIALEGGVFDKRPATCEVAA